MPLVNINVNRLFGSTGIGNICSAMERTLSAMPIIFITILLNMASREVISRHIRISM